MTPCPACESPLQPNADACHDCGRLLVSDLVCDEHPSREAVARCAVCRRAVCADCRKRKNFRNLCRTHGSVEVIDGHVDIRNVTTRPEAILLQGILEGAGIPTWIHDQKDSVNVINLGSLTPVKLLVPRDRYDEARAVLAEADRSAFELGAACAQCGRELPDATVPCPDCSPQHHST